MIGGFSDLFRYIMATIPFALLCLAGSKTNLSKQLRGHQFLSVVYSFVFTIVAIIKFTDFCNRLQTFIKTLIMRFSALDQKIPALAKIIDPIATLLSKIDLTYYIVFIGNFVLLALFYATKRMLLPIFKKLWSKESVYNATSGNFYQWYDSLSNFCLKSNMYAVKKLMKVYYYVATFLVVFLLVISRSYSTWPGFKAIMYPFAVVVVLGEIFFFLDGLTAVEYRNLYSGDDGSSSRVALYFPFAEYLKTLFGDRLIDSNLFIPGFRHNNADVLKKYEREDSQEAQLASLYFYKKATTRKKREAEELEERTKSVTANDKDAKAVQLDEALVDATYRLMNGESVMFATPFYRDYSDYIFLPINRALSRGNKVLVIVGRNGIEDDVKQWISDSLEGVVNVPELWDIQLLNNKENFEGEIGIVTPSAIFDGAIARANKDFISRVTEIIMLEPSQFISTAQLSLSVYVERVHKDATYYIFDRNNDGLVDTMSHIVKRSITAFTPTNRERNINSYMLWKADGDNLSHKLFPSVARYLGVGTELIITALKEQISVGEWYAYNKFPLEEMKWISQQYYPVLCEYASLPIEKDELETRMKFSNNMWGAEKSEYKYVVVEDEFCNLYEMARQFQNRGTKETFVNVISQNYLLRDYMEFNPTLFVNDPKAIPSFSPDFVRTDRNIALELLLKLQSGPMFESEIVKVLRYLGKDIFFGDYSTYDVKNALHDLIVTYVPDVKRSVETVIDERDKVYRLRKSSSSDSIDDALNNLKLVYYVLEDEQEECHYLDSKLYGQIFQSHLPGQHITIGGKYYEILVVGGDRGVVLKRAGDHINNREYYRQIRSYNISGFRFDGKIGGETTVGDIILNRGEANFSVSTNGYILMKDYGDLEHNCFKNIISQIPDRTYKNKSVLRITMPNISDKERVTITLLFNEIFKTTFPDNSDFICAVTELPAGVPDGLMYDFSDTSDHDENEKYIYIIEDSVLDMGLISSVERNIRRFFEIITDYLSWYQTSLLPEVMEPEYDPTRIVIDEKLLEDNVETKSAEKEKKSFFQKIKEAFSKKKKPKGENPEEETPEDVQEGTPEEPPVDDKSAAEDDSSNDSAQSDSADSDNVENEENGGISDE